MLCTDRPNTQYCVLSLREDGAIMHSLQGGHARLDKEECSWDIVQGLHEPQEPAYIVAYVAHDELDPQFEDFHTGHAAANASARFDQLKAGEQMRAIMLAQVIKEELNHE